MRVVRLVLILILSFLLLGLCGLLYIRFRGAGQPGPQAQPTPIPMVQVVVTTQDIARGQRITEEMVTTVEVPAAIEGQILDPKDAIGKLAARDLPKGIFLTQGDLAESPAELARTGSLASLNIPPGYVAISIPITRIGSVAYGIRPGDQVGVLVTLAFIDLDPEFQTKLPNQSALLQQQAQEGVPTSPVYQVVPGQGTIGRVVGEDYPLYAVPSEPQRPRLITQMIISDAQVLYLGTFPLEQPEVRKPAAEQEGEQQAQPPAQQPIPPGGQAPAQQTPPDVVTLIVKPQDALVLKYLMDRKVYFTLVLRSANDTQPLTTDPVTLNYLLEQYNIVIPGKQQADLEPRIDEIVPPDVPPALEEIQQ